MNRKSKLLKKLAFFMSVIMLIGVMPFSSLAAEGDYNYKFIYGLEGLATETGMVTGDDVKKASELVPKYAEEAGYELDWGDGVDLTQITITSQSAINENAATFTANYTALPNDVTFSYYENGKEIKIVVEDILTGQKIPAEKIPDVPPHPGMFAEWNPDPAAYVVKGSDNRFVLFTTDDPDTYTVLFLGAFDGHNIYIEEFRGVPRGTLVSELVAKIDPDDIMAVTHSSYSDVTYDHVGWDPPIPKDLKVTENMEFMAQYKEHVEPPKPEPTYYEVTFEYKSAEDNSWHLVTKRVPEGGDATPPEDITEIEGWEFTGWGGDYTNVTRNMTVTAQYRRLDATPETPTYTVTFVDWDGDVLDEQEVYEGGSASAPADPSRDGWKFLGWDGRGYISYIYLSLLNIREDTIITAVYEPEQATLDKDAAEVLDGIEKGKQIETIAEELKEYEVSGLLNGLDDAVLLRSGVVEDVYAALEESYITGGQKKKEPKKNSDNVKINVNKAIGEALSAPVGHEVQLQFDEPGEEAMDNAAGEIAKLNGSGDTKYLTYIPLDIKLMDVTPGFEGEEVPLVSPIIITVEIPDGLTADHTLRILHFSGSGAPEIITPKVDGGNICTFKVNHLSTFAFANEEASVPDPDEEDEDDGDDSGTSGGNSGSRRRRSSNNDNNRRRSSSEPRPTSEIAVASPSPVTPNWSVSVAAADAASQSAAQVSIPATADNTNSVRASVSGAMVQDAVMKSAANAGKLKLADPAAGIFMEFNVAPAAPSTAAAQNAFVGIDAGALKSLSDAGFGLAINTPVSNIKLDAAAVKELSALNRPSFVFSVKQVPAPFAAKQTAAGSSFYEIKLIDFFGQKVQGFTLGGGAEVTLAYKSAGTGAQAAYILNSSLTVIEDSVSDGTTVSWKNIFDGIFTVVDGSLAM